MMASPGIARRLSLLAGLAWALAAPTLAAAASWRYAEPTPDVDWVLGAIATRMRDDPIPRKARKHLSFAGDLARRIPEERFHYDGFTLDTYVVDAYESLEGDPDSRRVSAMLRFRDALGRKTAAGVLADYRLQGDRIVVETAFIAPLSAPAPRVDFFYVPADALPDRVLTRRTTHEQLWRDVVEHSLRLNRPGEWPQGEHDYLVFAFVMDRLAPDARLGLRISDTAKGMAGDASHTKVMNFDGWFAAVSSARFDLKSPKQPWFKVLYVPGGDLPEKERKRRAIGLFTNR